MSGKKVGVKKGRGWNRLLQSNNDREKKKDGGHGGRGDRGGLGGKDGSNYRQKSYYRSPEFIELVQRDTRVVIPQADSKEWFKTSKDIFEPMGPKSFDAWVGESHK